MPITTNCPNCAALFRLAEEMAGKTVKCQKCAHIFTVPNPDEPPTVPRRRDVETNDAAASHPMDPAGIVPPPPPKMPKTDPDDADEKRGPKPPPLNQGATRPPIKGRRRDEPASSGSGMMIVIFLVLGFGLLSCFGCAGVAGYWVYSESQQPRFKPGPVAFKDKDKKFVFDDKFDGKRDDMKPRPDDFKDGVKDKQVEPLPPGNVAIAIKPGRTHVSESVLIEKDPVNQFGRRYREYTVQLVAGQEYQFDMQSNQIDAHLYLYDDKNMLLAENDDFFGLDSHIRFRANRTGSYRIEAASHRGLQTGPYRLMVGRVEGGQPPNFDKK